MKESVFSYYYCCSGSKWQWYFISGEAKWVKYYSPLAAEARVVFEPFILALARGSQSFIWSIDAEILYLVLIEPGFLLPSNIMAIIVATTALTSQLSNILFEFVHRQSNRIADIVAKLYLINVLPLYWIVASLSALLCFITLVVFLIQCSLTITISVYFSILIF